MLAVNLNLVEFLVLRAGFITNLLGSLIYSKQTGLMNDTCSNFLLTGFTYYLQTSCQHDSYNAEESILHGLGTERTKMAQAKKLGCDILCIQVYADCRM